MTKEELLQDWLPRLWSVLQDVRCNESFAAQEALYELYVEMKQQTLAEKMSTFSEITLEDQMSAMAIELQSTQKRLAEIENSICQQAFVAKQEQGEPVAWESVSDFEIYEMYNEPRSDAEMLLFARELEAELKRRNKCASLKP